MPLTFVFTGLLPRTHSTTNRLSLHYFHPLPLSGPLTYLPTMSITSHPSLFIALTVSYCLPFIYYRSSLTVPHPSHPPPPSSFSTSTSSDSITVQDKRQQEKPSPLCRIIVAGPSSLSQALWCKKPGLIKNKSREKINSKIKSRAPLPEVVIVKVLSWGSLTQASGCWLTANTRSCCSVET